MKNQIIAQNFFNHSSDIEIEDEGELVHRERSELMFGPNCDRTLRMQNYKNGRETIFKVGKPRVEQIKCPEDYNCKSLGSNTGKSVEINLLKQRKRKKSVGEETLYFDYALSDSEYFTDNESLYRLDSNSTFFQSIRKLMKQARDKTSLNKNMLEKAYEEEKDMEPSFESANCSPSRRALRSNLRNKIDGDHHSILTGLNISNISDSEKQTLSEIENDSFTKNVQSNNGHDTYKFEEVGLCPGDEKNNIEQILLSSSQRKHHEIYIDNNLARQEYIKMLEQEVVGLKLQLADAQGSLDLVKHLQKEQVQEVETMKMEVQNLQDKFNENLITGQRLPIELIDEKDNKDDYNSDDKVNISLWFSWRPKCMRRTHQSRH